MTLKEKLAKYDNQQLVKIGAAGGNSFFFAGRLHEFMEGQAKYHKGVEEYYRKELKIAKESNLTKTAIRECRDRCNEVKKPFLEREVISSMEADFAVEPESTQVILIQGIERGGLWMISEAKESPFAKSVQKEHLSKSVVRLRRVKEHNTIKKCCSNCKYRDDIDYRSTCAYSGRSVLSMTASTKCRSFKEKKWGN